eukprot:scaffold96186_cov36-Phaeocystis_antarctica.AAC.1
MSPCGRSPPIWPGVRSAAAAAAAAMAACACALRSVRRAWYGGGRLAASASPGARGAAPPKTRLVQAPPFGGPGEEAREG